MTEGILLYYINTTSKKSVYNFSRKSVYNHERSESKS